MNGLSVLGTKCDSLQGRRGRACNTSTSAASLHPTPVLTPTEVCAANTVVVHCMVCNLVLNRYTFVWSVHSGQLWYTFVLLAQLTGGSWHHYWTHRHRQWDIYMLYRATRCLQRGSETGARQSVWWASRTDRRCVVTTCKQRQHSSDMSATSGHYRWSAASTVCSESWIPLTTFVHGWSHV